VSAGKTDRDDKIVAYLTAAEMANIRLAAAAEGLSLSAYVRRSALDHTARRIAEMRQNGTFSSYSQVEQSSRN
jgi:uncharacterized protein (DUF1778 family)